MTKTTIYYFSATGNSLKAAMDIAKLNDNTELVAINHNLKVDMHPESNRVGFIYPVYMGILPKIVEEFLSNFPTKNDVSYFAIATYNKYKGISLSIVDHILRKKGVALSYSNAIPTVGTCLMEYQVLEKERARKLPKADLKALAIAEDIKANVTKKTPKYSKLSDKIHIRLFYMYFGKVHNKFAVEDNCISCGKCEKVCPVQNITLVDGKPTWGDNCEACHACVHWCPTNSINIGKSKGRLQYHNPGITYPQIVPRKRKIFTENAQRNI